jgi:hypothetical protein
MGPPIEQATVDGYDMQFGIHVLGMSTHVVRNYNDDDDVCSSRSLAVHGVPHASTARSIRKLEGQASCYHGVVQWCLLTQSSTL